MSNRSVSCRKITLKVGKSFCRGNFSLYPADNFFSQGSEEMSKEYAWKVSRLCRFCTWSFSQSKITQQWWTDILLPRSLSLAALLRITCCCYGFMSCPRDSMAIQRFSCSQGKKLVTCHSRLGVAPCTMVMSTSMSAGIRVSHVKSSCDVISRDLFLCDSSLFSLEHINKKIQFLSKPNQSSTLFQPTCEKWIHSKNWFLWKQLAKFLLLVAVAL